MTDEVKEKKEDGAGEAERVSLTRQEYEALAKAAKELEEREAQLLRSAADFDNAKKRLVKEREEILKFALESTLHDLIPILDNFERAVAHAASGSKETKLLHDGFLLIQKQLFAVLRERGLKRLEVLGKEFDPHQHEAVGHVAAPDKKEGIVLEEVLSGYELNGKLVRPAKVKISAKKADPEPDEKIEELT